MYGPGVRPVLHAGIHGEDMAPAAFLYWPPNMSPPLYNHEAQLFVSLSQRASMIFHWYKIQILFHAPGKPLERCWFG